MDKTVTVYSYGDEVHVPLKGFQRVEKSTDFIGSIHRDDIYINATHFRWCNPKELKDYNYNERNMDIPWVIVPKNN